MNELEIQFPELAEALPRKALATLPTPVRRIEAADGRCELWVKRDDLSGELYGGNKVRKLEYLLGDALHRGARKVITFGTAGSNHALATGIYARACGLRSISMLMPQTNAAYVSRNLRMGLRAGIEFHAYPNDRACARALPWVRLRHRLRDGTAPVIIAGGGSSVIGTIGFVNAAFELRAQIARGELPEPDVIYVALGTMGTAAGLLLGMRAAGIRSRLVCVRVVQQKYANPEKFSRLLAATQEHLMQRVGNWPSLEPGGLVPEFRDEFFGGRYARFTQPGMDAIKRAARAGGPPLEGTYTGKAFAALLHDHDAGRLDDKSVLFWNTYNSRPFPADLDSEQPAELPEPLQVYFSSPVQALDEQE